MHAPLLDNPRIFFRPRHSPVPPTIHAPTSLLCACSQLSSDGIVTAIPAVVRLNFLSFFLGLGEDARERVLEDALVDHLTRFMLELGKGFAFVGRQYHLEVGEQDFYIDLLFYHLKLHCYVVIELKSGPFKPEYAGKLNFYLTAVDEEVKTPGDNPSIGLILCRDRDNVVAEYALRDLNKPIGVSRYELSATLPESLKASLPTLEEVEEGLTDERRGET